MAADLKGIEFQEFNQSGGSEKEQRSESTHLAHASCYGFDCFGLASFIDGLRIHFGDKLLALLFVVQFLLKGFVVDFLLRAQPYLYKQYNVPAPKMQTYNGVSQLPWAMKPVIGLVSDVCPVRGYNKAPYVFMTSALGVVALLSIGFVPQESMPIRVLVTCFVAIQLQASTSDLLSEAKYAEKMRDNPKHGPSLMTYVWFGVQVGGLVAVCSSGIVIDHFGPKACYLIASLPAAFVIGPVLMNYMEESRLTEEQISATRRHFWSQREACLLCLLMLLGTTTLTLLGLFSTVRVTCVAAICVAIVMLVSFSVTLSPAIAKFNAFSLIQTSMSLSIGGASFYFFTDTEEQYPGGPNFSPFFFNTVLGVVTSLVSLLGISLYQRYMTSWKYRNILIATNVAYSIMCIPDMILFARLNRKVHIPDEVFMLGSAVATNIILTWQWMPQVVILSYLCPKGMEATMYALLAGCHNLGNTIAANCGAVLLEWLQCAPSGEKNEAAQFEYLWVASAVATALPLLTILSLFWLIPDARQDENILKPTVQSATSGSLWRSWSGTDDELDAALD